MPCKYSLAMNGTTNICIDSKSSMHTCILRSWTIF